MALSPVFFRELRQSNYLNNLIEQDHRFLKRLVKLEMGFFSFETCAGYIGYPFEKSKNCASKIPLSHCQYEEIDALTRKIENR